MVSKRVKRLLGRGGDDDTPDQEQARIERARAEARRQAREEVRTQRQQAVQKRAEREAELEARKEQARVRRGGGATGALAAGAEELRARAERLRNQRDDGGGRSGDGRSAAERGMAVFDTGFAVDKDKDGIIEPGETFGARLPEERTGGDNGGGETRRGGMGIDPDLGGVLGPPPANDGDDTGEQERGIGIDPDLSGVLGDDDDRLF